MFASKPCRRLPDARAGFTELPRRTLAHLPPRGFVTAGRTPEEDSPLFEFEKLVMPSQGAEQLVQPIQYRFHGLQCPLL